MYKPTSIVIAGINYKIEYKAISDWGRMNEDKKIITLSTKIKDTETIVDTLLHEVLHAVLRMSGLYYSLLKANDSNEEGVVRGLENLYLPVVKNVLKEAEVSLLKTSL